MAEVQQLTTCCGDRARVAVWEVPLTCVRVGSLGRMSAAEGERALCFTGRGEDGLQMENVGVSRLTLIRYIDSMTSVAANAQHDPGWRRVAL